MLRIIGFIFMLGALGAGSNAGYLQLKALLAQHLLDVAWTNSIKQGAPSKPWPWADTWPVARLTVPALDTSMVVLEGTSGEAMAFGPGRMIQSAQSVTGVIGIGGHRDTHLSFLENLAPGSLFELELISGQQAQYRYTEAMILDTRHDTLSLSSSHPGLVLVTCYPFSAAQTGGPLRYVVSAIPITNPTGDRTDI